MASLKTNILSNLIAGVWTTVLTAVITPLQVNLLGVESYGLIGFIATLQIVFSAFDLGLSSTLTREIASDATEDNQRSRHLIRTASTVYWAFALVVGAALAAGASWIAGNWFTTQAMPVREIESALYLITAYLALRWPIALYTGILSGLQRLVIVNILKIAIVSLRLVGGIAVILIWRDIEPFLIWTALTAFAEVIAYFLTCRHYCPFASWRPGISLSAIRSVWGFSLAMTAISLLALFISQLDRILVSKLLPLRDLGYYTLAFSTAAITSVAISAVSTAMLPSFASWQSNPSIKVLQARYQHATNVILFIVGAASFSLAFFGRIVLDIWIGPEAAANASAPLAFLAVGFWLNAVVSNSYSVAVALGRPGLPLAVSAASAVPYAVLLYGFVIRDGIAGAAAAWMILNACYIAVLVPIVHRKLLQLPTGDWLLRTIGPFALLGVGSFGGARLIADNVSDGRPVWAGVIALCGAGIVYVSIGWLLLGRRIRGELMSLVGIAKLLGGRPRSPLAPSVSMEQV